MRMQKYNYAEENAINQWSAITGPRTGAGPWRVRYRSVESLLPVRIFSSLNTLEYICNILR